MKVHVVITTIFPPSSAVRAFAQRKDVHVVVVGDRKTPRGWSCPGVDFLPFEDQPALSPQLAGCLPPDHYARKMLGYVHAMRQGADLIFDTDDDNAPLESWHIPDCEGIHACTPPDLGFVNVYRSFTSEHIWPRGFPLRFVNDPRTILADQQLAGARVRVGVWQGLVDGEADVDAIYRLTVGRQCHFNRRHPVVLGYGSICPFNSQNTFFHRQAFPLLFLPAQVTFRFTDILRGLVAQPALWAAGLHVGFRAADVRQERNSHDLLADFRAEIPCYLLSDSILEHARGQVHPGRSVAENLHAVYEELVRQGIVPPDELERLEVFLQEVKRTS